MKAFLIFAILIAYLLTNISCNKTSIYPDHTKFKECSNVQNTDSTTVVKKIVGSWKLLFAGYGEGETLNTNDVKIKFLTNGTFKLFQYSSLIEEGKWEVVKNSPNSFILHVIDQNTYLADFGYICSNQIFFNYGYIDGLDALYEKIY